MEKQEQTIVITVYDNGRIYTKIHAYEWDEFNILKKILDDSEVYKKIKEHYENKNSHRNNKMP